MDISFLKKSIDPITAKLTVIPLAPLSMVSSLPGGHYKTQKEPTHFMLCGLFENILGLHVSIKDREAIRKDLIKSFKQNKINSNSTYQPLLGHLFSVEMTMIPPLSYHTDLWKRSYRRADAIVHPKGTPNLDHSMIGKKNLLKRDEKGKIKDSEYEGLFKANIGRFPLYYSTLSSREYITANGNYLIKLLIDTILFKELSKALLDNDLGYLGTNDGWVSLKLEQL